MTLLKRQWKWLSWAPSIHEPKKNRSTKNGNPLYPETPIQIIPQSILGNYWAKQYLLPLPSLKAPMSLLPVLLSNPSVSRTDDSSTAHLKGHSI